MEGETYAGFCFEGVSAHPDEESHVSARDVCLGDSSHGSGPRGKERGQDQQWIQPSKAHLSVSGRGF